VPVYEITGEGRKGMWLSLTPPAGGGARASATVAFYAVDPAAKGMESAPIVDLYEFAGRDGEYIYTSDGAFSRDGFVRSPKPLCRVWPNPIQFDPLAWEYKETGETP